MISSELAFKLSAVLLCGSAIFLVFFSFIRDPQSLPYRYWSKYTVFLERQLRNMFILTSGALIARGQVAVLALAVGLTLYLEQPLLYLSIPLILFGPVLYIENKRKSRLRAIEAKMDSFILTLANALKSTPSIGNALAYAQPLIAPPLDEEIGLALFLDELGELPLDLQPKLLRVLEKREVRRVGGSTAFPIDVRLVSATHRKLTHEIQAGRFRQDLYFRLAAAHVKVPPLRERLDDLPLLVDHLLQQMHSSLSHESLPEATWQMLLTHRWPGNVRELKNVLQRFLITPERSLPLSGDSAPPPPSPSPVQLLPLREARRQASDAFEREYLKQLLAQTGGNVSRAASLAEVSRQMIQKLMRQHGY